MHGRRFGRTSFVGLLCVLVALQAGCKGSSAGPSGPRTFEVSGSWVEVSTLISDTCGLDLPPTSSVDVTIVQGTNQITFVFHVPGQNVTVVGTFNSLTGEFSLSLSFQEGGTTLTIVQSGRFTSNSQYTSESTLVFTEGGQSCTVRTSEVGQRRT